MADIPAGPLTVSVRTEDLDAFTAELQREVGVESDRRRRFLAEEAVRLLNTTSPTALPKGWWQHRGRRNSTARQGRDYGFRIVGERIVLTNRARSRQGRFYPLDNERKYHVAERILRQALPRIIRRVNARA